MVDSFSLSTQHTLKSHLREKSLIESLRDNLNYGNGSRKNSPLWVETLHD